MPKSANETVARSLTNAKNMCHRFCEDLTPPEYLHRPCDSANCVAWLLGHLTLVNRHAATRLGATDLPLLPEGFDKRFGRGENAPASEDFGDTSKLLGLFEQNTDALIAAVERATPEQFDKPNEKPHPMFSTAGEFANFMAIHTAMHVGQITIIRRSLGRPPII